MPVVVKVSAGVEKVEGEEEARRSVPDKVDPAGSARAAVDSGERRQRTAERVWVGWRLTATRTDF